MFSNNAQELELKLKALDASQATIEFDMEGKVLTANANFLSVLGYTLEEIQGSHHSMFLYEDDRDSVAYRQFCKHSIAASSNPGNTFA